MPLLCRLTWRIRFKCRSCSESGYTYLMQEKQQAASDTATSSSIPRFPTPACCIIPDAEVMSGSADDAHVLDEQTDPDKRLPPRVVTVPKATQPDSSEDRLPDDIVDMIQGAKDQIESEQTFLVREVCVRHVCGFENTIQLL